ncbi:unnamed protein product [Orchesella dallaii]|uniref:Cytochrome P450 4C1 n=1 Tax=Orchesella dallaii TaxID=48710 RepID=A0ABP1R7U5_9HEXA
MSYLTNSNSSCFDRETQIADIIGSKKRSYLTANLLGVIVLFLGFYRILKKRIKSNNTLRNVINDLPGPSAIPLIGNCHLILAEKDIISMCLRYGKKYGPIFRVWVGTRPIVALNSPKFVEKLLSSNESGHLHKPDIYEAMADYMDEGLITSSGEKWRARRKLLSPLFNYKCFNHFINVFNRQSEDLVRELDTMFPNGEDKPKPIQNALLGSALKVICESAMGVDTSASSAAEFCKFFEDASTCKEFIKRKVLSPWLKVGLIWKLHPFSKAYEENVKAIKDFMYKVIYQARDKFSANEESYSVDEKEIPTNKTVMEVLLESGFTDADIREEAHTVISAGHETIGSTLQFTLMLLALHPEHQTRCQEEVDDVLKNESKCPQGDFTLSALTNLKYIERCVKETLRLFPIVYAYARTLKSPLKLDENITLPDGTDVFVLASNIHRDPQYYPEPETFNPSRFTPENCVNRHPYAYLPFSGGPRYCLGTKFAMVELKLIVARILYHYNIYTTDKIEDVPMENSILLNPVRGYNFLLKKRTKI